MILLDGGEERFAALIRGGEVDDAHVRFEIFRKGMPPAVEPFEVSLEICDGRVPDGITLFYVASMARVAGAFRGRV